MQNEMAVPNYQTTQYLTPINCDQKLVICFSTEEYSTQQYYKKGEWQMHGQTYRRWAYTIIQEKIIKWSMVSELCPPED